MPSKVKFSYKAIGEVMNSDGVVGLMGECAQAIASAAGSGFSVVGGAGVGKTRGAGGRFVKGATRPRAYVAPITFDAKRRQSREHVLERSIDAGRKP